MPGRKHCSGFPLPVGSWGLQLALYGLDPSSSPVYFGALSPSPPTPAAASLPLMALGRPPCSTTPALYPCCFSLSRTLFPTPLPVNSIGPLGAVLDSWGCWNKQPQTEGLKITLMYCPTVLEARIPNSWCWQGSFLLEALRQSSSHASVPAPAGSSIPWLVDVISLVSASMFTQHLLCICDNPSPLS